jgi:hypothetical protein
VISYTPRHAYLVSLRPVACLPLNFALWTSGGLPGFLLGGASTTAWVAASLSTRSFSLAFSACLYRCSSASISLMPFLNPNLKSAILLCCAKALRGLTDFRAKPFIFEPRTNFLAVARTLLFISPQKPFPHPLETIFLSPHPRWTIIYVQGLGWALRYVLKKQILAMSNQNWNMGDFLESLVWSSMDQSNINFKK